jgi:hypothetical protein
MSTAVPPIRLLRDILPPSPLRCSWSSLNGPGILRRGGSSQEHEQNPNTRSGHLTSPLSGMRERRRGGLTAHTTDFNQIHDLASLVTG